MPDHQMPTPGLRSRWPWWASSRSRPRSPWSTFTRASWCRRWWGRRQWESRRLWRASASSFFPTSTHWYPLCILICKTVAHLGHVLDFQGHYSHVLPLVIMGTLSVMGGIAALFLPETLWKHLPNTLAEGEAFGSKFKICSCPHKYITILLSHGVSFTNILFSEENDHTISVVGEEEGETVSLYERSRNQQPNGRIEVAWKTT